MSPDLLSLTKQIQGARVDGSTVVLSARGGNDEARRLCAQLVAAIEASRRPSGWALVAECNRDSATIVEDNRQPLHKMELCDCADHGAYCRGRQPGKACRAHDDWYTQPCDKGQCPGPGDAACCHRAHPDAWMEDPCQT